jgi:hypothetical protein
MDESPSWESNSFWACREISRTLWTPYVHYRIQNSLARETSIQLMLSHSTSWRPILILSSYIRLSVISEFLTSVPPTQTVYSPLLPLIRAICPASFILLVRNGGHRTPHYVVFSASVLPLPFYAKIYSSAPHSHTTPVYVTPSIWETKHHIHKNNRQITGLCIFKFLAIKTVRQESMQVFADFSLLFIFSWLEFCFVVFVSKYVTYFLCSKTIITCLDAVFFSSFCSCNKII